MWQILKTARVRDLPEKTTKLRPEEAYTLIENALEKNRCKIVERRPLDYLKVKQGSLNGTSPKTAKKQVEFQFFPDGSGTRIVSFSEIATDWAELTVFGNVAAAVIATIFLWIAKDVQAYAENGRSGFWGWLAHAYGYPDLHATMFLVNLTRGLAAFLIAAVAVEVLIVLYVYPRKEVFALEILEAVP